MFKLQRFHHYDTSTRCRIKNAFEYHKALNDSLTLKIKHRIFKLFFVTKSFDYEILRDSDRTRYNTIDFDRRNRSNVVTRAQIVEIDKILEKIIVDDENVF